MADAKPRHWKAWMLLTSEGEVHTVHFRYDPSDLLSTKQLMTLGWSVIPVQVTEVLHPDEMEPAHD